MSEMKC
ncbi:hypothetical protein V3C99_017827, partial [Haemonchus contortus]